MIHSTVNKLDKLSLTVHVNIKHRITKIKNLTKRAYRNGTSRFETP